MQEYYRALKKEYPLCEVIGYWKVPEGYIFHTKIEKDYTAPADFLVDLNFKVIGVNPFNYPNFPRNEFTKI